MSTCVEKIAHPECGSGDGVQIFSEDGKYTGFCFACDTFLPNPYHDKPAGYKPKPRLKRTEEEIRNELLEIAGLASQAVDKRKISKDTLEYYNIKTALSETDGTTPTVAYFPYTAGGKVEAYKARLLAEKRIWFVGNTEGVNLFGWEQALASGAKRLFITEGEWDAAACYEALKKKQKGTQFADFEPAIVSLTRGAGHAAKDISASLRPIQARFKDIVLVFDQDAAGEQATKEVLQLLPNAKTVALPAKDPNACLLEGRAKALANALLFTATEHKTTRIVCASTLFEEAREAPEWGLSWPWPIITDLTRGIRLGETIYLGAGVKMGKSEVVNALAAHFIVEHDMPVFVAKPEEANKKTVKMIAGKVVGRHFHDPKVVFDDAAYDRGVGIIGDKLKMMDLYQYMGWKDLRADINAAAIQLGCKAIFIDPITNLVMGHASGDQNTMLQEIAQELAAMAKQLDIVVFIFCHLKAPLGGDTPHEMGGRIYSSQFAGSRAMMRSCHMMLGLEGNKDPEQENAEVVKHIRKLIILEDREFGASGYARLWWEPDTGLFSEMKEG